MAKGKAKEKPKYEMPKVSVGQAVSWHEAVGSPPTAMALVTAVYPDTVSLAVLGPGYHNFLVREGVRHVDHPDKDIIAHSEVGCWSYTERDLAIEDRLTTLEVLMGSPMQAPDMKPEE
jgi:hypothetical protein